MDLLSTKEVLCILAPNIIAGIIFYITRDSYEDKSTDPWFKPNRYAFFIVWTFLFSYMGYFLAKTLGQKNYDLNKLKYYILILFFFCFLWMFIYASDNPRVAILVFIPLINFALACENQIYKLFGYSYHLFTAWLIFALILSSFTE